ncbi:MAG: nucleotide-binding protein [Acidobacteriota bacterium]
MRRTALVLALALTAACGQKSAVTEAAKPAPASPASAAAAVPQAPQPALTSVTGIVEETLDASDYTYMRLKTESGGETWAAITKAKVQKGDRVTVVNAMAMDGFESKTLNRKFDHIVFGALEGGKTGAAPAPVSAHGAPANASKGAEVASPHAAVSDGKAEAMDVKVPKAEGKDAYTIAQVFADRAKLKDKIVTVRGKVVKANGGIMGRNWYHIRDGSGSREKKDDDLTVTSNDPAIVGDVVVVKGVVHVEKDFGAGYQYPVVVEDAKVAKEPASTRADASR